MKTVFSDKRVYWALVSFLIIWLLLHVLMLSRSFELLTLLHTLWVGAVLYVLLIKHRNALLNIKLWLTISIIGGSLLQIVGRYMREMTQDSSSTSLEFYLYRVLLILVGLVMLNWVRTTVKIEKKRVKTRYLPAAPNGAGKTTAACTLPRYRKVEKP